ncbi:MAG: hypothetical protein ACP5Q4_06325 [Candidatus Caldatribacteriaceae bacterium]
MRKSKARIVFLSIPGLAVVLLLSLTYFSTRVPYGILKGKVTDLYSQDVVRKLTLSIGGRSDILFQSKDYRITRIPPGKHTLKAEAPYYHPVTQELEIKKGENVFDFTMEGKEIPGLAGIICFADPTDRGIEIEIRFKDAQGVGISDFPGFPLQLEGKLYVREGDADNFSRGRLLFEGPIELFWDPKAYLARNKGLISWDKIQIDREKEQYGLLELLLRTPQGNFEDTIEDVELVKKEE